ncbi:hypothetical protein N825_09920 [Skermanella stibiiresistens SB22]|uniref:J domain-containing protein n=1 Tax=Skermanella stibiiresistens SB22 TaxID=1385369 RepID=W9GSC3_9PROT|nr:hypothetical protein N825_09920 [Skermanella stibiiresistens SB22]
MAGLTVKRDFGRRVGPGFPGRGAFGEFGTLLRLVFGTAASTVAAYLDRLDPGNPRGRTRSSGAGDGIEAAARCRRELASARAQRDHLASEIRRYDTVRDVLIGQIASETDGARRATLTQSLTSLEDRLTGWLDEHDLWLETIARLEADLSFFDAVSGKESSESPPDPEPAGARTSPPPPDPVTARHLAALGLNTVPADLDELKSAYRARLKAVHPDVSGQASTDAAALATVAFAELRRRFG